MSNSNVTTVYATPVSVTDPRSNAQEDQRARVQEERAAVELVERGRSERRTNDMVVSEPGVESEVLPPGLKTIGERLAEVERQVFGEVREGGISSRLAAVERELMGESGGGRKAGIVGRLTEVEGML